MYRNFGSQGRGEPEYAGNHSGSSSGSLGSSSSSSIHQHHQQQQQQQQKFPTPGGSQFVPSLNAITTNQDLQWLVQPSLMHPPGPSRSPVPPYPSMLGPRSVAPPPPQPHLIRPGVIRAAAFTPPSMRRRYNEQLSNEDLERRRIRRERNKLAAAKCRNRRRELTDSLQNETEQLEDEKSRLQKEIAQLQKEKEKLELVLEAHRPICKIDDSDSDSDPVPSLSSLGAIKLEPEESSIPAPSTRKPAKTEKSKPKITIPAKPAASSHSVVAASESESLHTPVLISTPSLLSFSAGMVFTYPSSTSEAGTSTAPHQALHPQHQRPCGVAHRRSSSSGDQSDHSLHSPTILTL